MASSTRSGRCRTTLNDSGHRTVPQRGAGGHVRRLRGRPDRHNSCRNRHCPKCQASAAQRWLDARQADLLPVEYYHVVFTLPAPIAAIAYQNKAVVYGLLFDVAAETLQNRRRPKHLGARIGATLVLHTWGSALTHHPHVHGIVPGGGLSPDGERWIACRPGFFLPVRVLSRLFRRRFLEELQRAHAPASCSSSASTRRSPMRQPSTQLARAAAPVRVGRLRQAPVRRPRGGAGLPVALHAPRGHLQQPAARAWTSTASPSAGRTIAPRAARATRPMTLAAEEFMRRFLLHVLPERLPPHPPLRSAGQRQPQGQPGAGARAVARACVRSAAQDAVVTIKPASAAADLRVPALRPPRWSSCRPSPAARPSARPRRKLTRDDPIPATHARPACQRFISKPRHGNAASCAVCTAVATHRTSPLLCSSAPTPAPSSAARHRHQRASAACTRLQLPKSP